PLIHGNEIKVKEIFEYFFENLGKYRREDMAYAAEKYMALSLAEIALEKAEEEGVKSIGISGGCAYNDFIVSEISRLIRERGFDFYQNERIPCGDGGVSFGQGIYYSFIEN
ncbi:MAG: carbamoyltransferase HypF, partial [Thermoplasmata archaeon]|nr:carbamoyltransferase HypF [Thermoplasmata archaeon]